MGKRIGTIGQRMWADMKNYKEVALIFAAYYIFTHVVFHAFCPLVMFAGLPCAGCGMTRAVFFMLTGQFARSFALNPMALPVIIFVVYCAFCRYILGKKVKGFQTGVIILCIFLLLIYIYQMVTVFPGRPPYIYTSGNFLERTVPYYREILQRLTGI